MLKTLILCEHIDKAASLWKKVCPAEGVDLRILLTRGAGVPPRSFAATIARSLVSAALKRSGFPFARLYLTGRLRITSRELHDPATIEWIRNNNFDAGLHATGCIYRKPLLESFRLGLINPHIGILPEYRGRSVMEWSLLKGDPTGITTFFMDEGIDTGPEIIIRREIDVSGCGSVEQAKHKLFSLDGRMFREALRELQKEDYRPIMQEPADGTRYYVMSELFTGVVENILGGGRSDVDLENS